MLLFCSNRVNKTSRKFQHKIITTKKAAAPKTGDGRVIRLVKRFGHEKKIKTRTNCHVTKNNYSFVRQTIEHPSGTITSEFVMFGTTEFFVGDESILICVFVSENFANNLIRIHILVRSAALCVRVHLVLDELV